MESLTGGLNGESVQFAQRWLPEEHIIFCVGVRVRYDDYRKVYGLTATRQSLFTINPGTKHHAEILSAVEGRFICS